MTVARSVASSVAGPTAKPVAVAGSSAGGAASYDTDALDYFTRAEALGGSFNLSGINATYTEAYVKSAISTFVAGCKTDSTWTKITEAYLLSGVTFGGMLAKLKYTGTATLTNANFVTGDYVAAGSGAGLKGDGSTKYLITNLNDNVLSQDSKSFGCYPTTAPTSTFMAYMNARATPRWELGSDTVASTVRVYAPFVDAAIAVASQNTPGMIIASRRGVNDIEVYKNGASVATDTSTAAASTADVVWHLFSQNNNGTPAGYSDARMSLAFLGSGLTTADALAFSTRVNTLMTALGANAY